MPPEVSCFREANLLPRRARQIQNSKEKVREITQQTRTLVPRFPARSSSLPTMLGIGGVFAHFVEDRISRTRVIARDEDLYGKRSRHWSMADPIAILVWLALGWLALSLSGVYWRDELRNKTTIQNHEWSIYDVVLTTVTILRAVQLCQMFH